MPLGRRGDAMNSRQRAVNELASCGFGFACGPCDIRVVSLEYLAEQNGSTPAISQTISQIGLMASFCYNSIWRKNPIVTPSIRGDQFVTCSIPKDANGV